MKTLLGIRSLAVALRANAAATRVPVEGGRWQLNGLAFSWLGNYVLLPEVKRGQSVVIRFPMTEATETVDLAWRLDQFWLESTQPSASWQGTKPTRFTLAFRGNTLADIQPPDSRAGFALYGDRTLERYRQPAPARRVTRFVPTER